jgi:hypothetical protein
MTTNSTKQGLIAVIADIIDSKKIDVHQRRVYQKQLKDILKKINNQFYDDICSNFIITLGDEFQGVLNNAEHLFDIIDMIQFNLKEIRIRFGIGIGEIVTDIDREASIGSDGPAYHRARNSLQALKKIKNNEQNLYIQTPDLLINELLNTHLFWISKTNKRWSDLQLSIIEKKIETNNITQNEIAILLDIDQSRVSRSLKASSFENYLQSQKAICQIIEKERRRI